MPVSGINFSYNNTGVIGSQDGDIQIKLAEGHRPTDDYVRAAARRAAAPFPGATFAFLPADIVSQILNFGAPAPIDVQVAGANLAANFAYANLLLRRLRHIPGVADARIQQSPRFPSSTSTSIAPALNTSASPSATSPTAWSSISPAAARSRRPIGSTRRAAFPIRSSCRRRNTVSTR